MSFKYDAHDVAIGCVACQPGHRLNGGVLVSELFGDLEDGMVQSLVTDDPSDRIGVKNA